MKTLVLAALALQDAPFFPLEEGSSWEYSLSNGATMTLKIVGREKLKGVDCAVIETSLGGQSNREWLGFTAEGFKAFKIAQGGRQMEYEAPLLRIKLPFKPGDTWSFDVQAGFQTVTVQMKSDRTESIQTRAGKFDCIVVVMTAGAGMEQVRQTTWFAQGVGLIKQVFESGGQQLTAELVRTSVQPAKRAVETPPVPEFAKDLERYESKDGKVILAKPRGWKVEEGDMFGEGTYAVTLEHPNEDGGVMFMAMNVEGLKDSVELATRTLAGLQKAYPDQNVAKMTSSKDRSRTTAELSLTDGGRKYVGHLHFFHTGRAATVFALMAVEDRWEKMSPLLTTLCANIAYAPEGIKNVLERGRELARSGGKPSFSNLRTPAEMIKAARETAPHVRWQKAAASDGSFAMAVPEGWSFEGAQLVWRAYADRAKSAGYVGVGHQVVLPNSMGAGMTLTSNYLPPAQALDFVMRHERLGQGFKILSESGAEALDPSQTQQWQQARATGVQVDLRVFYAEFTGPSGQASRGIFAVVCAMQPMSTGWSAFVYGGWAPADKFDEFLPVCMAMEKTIQNNDAWIQGTLSQQQAVLRQSQRNLMNSIADLNKAYDRYNEGHWERQRSRDYTSWAYSQSTLGQGSWVSEREGAEVVRTDSWGMTDMKTGERHEGPWNYTNTTGVKRDGEWLNQVDTREEYDRYIRGR